MHKMKMTTHGRPNKLEDNLKILIVEYLRNTEQIMLKFKLKLM